MSAAQENTRLLLEVRQKIYPRAVSGVFARWRWACVWLTQLVYYLLPWIPWQGRQAVLFDIASRKFYIFGLVLQPQDFIYLTGLLVVSALSLFLFTTVAGRLWCGYTCPQTVYSEIFLWLERKVEGERVKRMKLDSAPMSVRKFRVKAAKHTLWLVFSLWTGITFVGYFTPIMSLVADLVQLSAGPWAKFWIVFYAFATYGNAGFLREQVCKYMCPYARFQGVMFDRDTLVITYDAARGEARGPRARSADYAALGLGHCIDCNLCVDVCPTGIDIRDGQQYECIGCAACIDACDKVMDKIGYPSGLIRYDTLNRIDSPPDQAPPKLNFFRPRVLIYTTVIATVVGVLLTGLGSRVPLKVDVMRDRGVLSREVGDGLFENTFRVMLINSAEVDRDFRLSVDGLSGAYIESGDIATVGSLQNRLVVVRVRAPADSGRSGSNPIHFTVRAERAPDVVRNEKSVFFLP